jgi:hypothetical protein
MKPNASGHQHTCIIDPECDQCGQMITDHTKVRVWVSQIQERALMTGTQRWIELAVYCPECFVGITNIADQKILYTDATPEEIPNGTV